VSGFVPLNEQKRRKILNLERSWVKVRKRRKTGNGVEMDGNGGAKAAQ
jgi:hypothetical protein